MSVALPSQRRATAGANVGGARFLPLASSRDRS